MQDPTDRSVHRLGFGERLVPALVRNDPEAGCEETRPKAIQRPDRETGKGIESGVGQRDGLRIDKGVSFRYQRVEGRNNDQVLDTVLSC